MYSKHLGTRIWPSENEKRSFKWNEIVMGRETKLMLNTWQQGIYGLVSEAIRMGLFILLVIQKIQNSTKYLVERFKGRNTWFLCMSEKASPVNKYSFPEYAIYFRMSICTAAIGQGLDSSPLGIQNFGMTKQSIHFSPFAAKAVLGEKRISTPDQLVSKS